MANLRFKAEQIHAEKKKKHREISIENWISTTTKNRLKKNIYSAFDRILKDLRLDESFAKSLIIIQILQLIAITSNEENMILAKILPISLLQTLKMPLVYSYFDLSGTGLKMFLTTFVLVYLTWVYYGAIRILRLGEKEHRKLGKFKQNYGVSLYLLDTVLVRLVKFNFKSIFFLI